MQLVKQTEQTNTYQQDNMLVYYNHTNGRARLVSTDGIDTKRRKPKDMTEDVFVRALFNDIHIKVKNKSLSDIIKAFKKSRDGKIAVRTQQEDEVLLAQSMAMFGELDLVNATTKEVRDLLEDANICSNDKRNRVKKKMQQVVDFAIAEDMLRTNRNVFKGIKLYTVPKYEKNAKLFFESHKDVPKEHHTIQRLYNVANTPQQRMMILLLTVTGARINEIMSLTWDDITTKNKHNPIIRICNSKIKPTDTNMDMYRYMDIAPSVLQTMLEHKTAMQNNPISYGQMYGSGTTAPTENRLADRRPKAQWKYILSGLDGYKPSYTTIRRWYADMWARAYDKYIDHADYPFLWERNPKGLTFHAFRRHYVCSFRDSIDNFSLTDHERLQQLVGHTVGSGVTNKMYTEWKASKVTDAQMNSKINLGVDF